MESLASLSLDRVYTVLDVQIHLAVMLAMFVLAFFAFTLSLRQFNHFCIMLGALDHDRITSEEEIEAIARMNALGAKNFNSGIRAYYFSVATWPGSSPNGWLWPPASRRPHPRPPRVLLIGPPHRSLRGRYRRPPSPGPAQRPRRPRPPASSEPATNEV